MQNILWFAMPGAVLLAPLLLVEPSWADTEAKAAVLVLVTPVIGFVLHQIFRLLYESTGGYARRSRKVLHFLAELSEETSGKRIDLREAFLVWEITFYGDRFPPAFREHDRGAWHYVKSFWSTGLAALVCLVAALLLGAQRGSTSEIVTTMIVAGLLATLFFIKGRQTLLSLLDQEVAMAKRHRELFIETMESIFPRARSA